MMTAVADARRSRRELDFVQLLEIVRGEFLEMPGLRLTMRQAQRLWAIDADTCEAVLGALEASAFLRHTPGGEYLLAWTKV